MQENKNATKTIRKAIKIKKFYELYKDNEKVSTLLTQLSWTNHLKIMSACKNKA